MIRINLLSSLGIMQSGGEGAGIVSVDLRKQAVINLMIIFAAVGVVMVYETINLSNLNATLQGYQKQIEQIQSQKSQYGEIAPKFEKYTKQKEVIDKKVEVIRGIAKHRLREVKALDAIQGLIPAQVWLRSLKIEGPLVKAEGYSSSEDAVSNFFAAVDNSGVFTEFFPASHVEEALGSSRVRKFEVSFRIGKAEPEEKPAEAKQ
jgi:Tfp pilus assembly protein PilN